MSQQFPMNNEKQKRRTPPNLSDNTAIAFHVKQTDSPRRSGRPIRPFPTARMAHVEMKITAVWVLAHSRKSKEELAWLSGLLLKLAQLLTLASEN